MVCPGCGFENDAGTTRCADCDLLLVAELPLDGDSAQELRMVRVVGPTEGPMIQALLDKNDIPSLLQGEMSEATFPVAGGLAGVRVWVREADWKRAGELIDSLFGGPEEVERPELGDEKDEEKEDTVPTTTPSTKVVTDRRSRRRLIYETGIVLLLFWVPPFLFSLAARSDPAPPPTLESEAYFFFVDLGRIALLVFLIWRNRETLQTLGFRRTRWWAELIWAFVVYCTMWSATMVLYSLFGTYGSDETAISRPQQPPEGFYAVVLPVFLLVAALFEEILYRGYLWNRIEQLTGRTWVALAFTSLLWAVAHPYSFLSVADIFLHGLVLGFFYWQQRSLPQLVIAHFAFNLFL